MFRLHMVGRIVRQAGLGHITAVFLFVFFSCAGAVCFAEGGRISFGDSLWICFQTISTIGFGDVATDVPGTRLTLVLLSIVSIFYLAVITGVVVAYCNQLVQSNARNSVVRMADKLEHLETLSRAELRELSRQARALKQDSSRCDEPMAAEKTR